MLYSPLECCHLVSSGIITIYFSDWFKMKLFLLFISIACGIFISPVFSCISVNTPLGVILGTTVPYNEISVKAFLGIPYVKPPLGELRFKKPVPIDPWNTPIEAISLPPGCPQYSSNPFPWLDAAPGQSENCLYLNIWVPPTASVVNKKSVILWIHTGGFRISSSGVDFIQGQVLAADGDVIVVSTNYRLGAFGFFYSNTHDAPGNVGLLDIIESLKWVKNNIESFGGDRDSITLAGHSAGGIAIGMLTVSPLSRGLFNRAILESGAPTILAGEDNDGSFKISQKLAEAVGCANDSASLKNYPSDVVQCMRNVDACELAVKLAEVTADSPRSYYPRFGDEVLPKNPRTAIIDGDFEPVDVLIGSNNGDGSTLLTKKYKNETGFFGEKDFNINITFAESILEDKFKNLADPDAIVRHYLNGLNETDYNEIRFQVLTALGDYGRTCPTAYFAESFAKKNPNVYYYFFTNRPSYTPWAPWMLAVHHDEVHFIFGYPLRYKDSYSLSDQILSKWMIQAWSSFAKTGRPALYEWPQYSREFPTYQQLDTGTNFTGIGPHFENCNFFRPVFGF